MKRSVVLAGLVTLVGGLALWLGPLVYQCRLHPLAELARSVEEGEWSVTAVDSLIADYLAEDASGQAQYSPRRPGRASAPGQPEDATAFLHVYDWWLLDDLQLTVWFDRDDRVVGVFYLCD